jgi:NAD-dependent SIR2 family protein deacetylase
MTHGATEEAVQAAATVIAGADALLIAAGAGMGVDSGLPTFRGPEADGFARAWPSFGRPGVRYEELMSPAAFDADPHRAWGFHGSCLKMYLSARPHAGYAALLAVAANRPAGWFVYTSNVDGHFQRAGFDDGNVMECHGSALRLQCTEPCGHGTWVADAEAIVLDPHTGRALEPLPRCPRCDAVARPNIRMFADGQWVGRETAAQSARFEAWKARAARCRAVAIVECGAGTSVPAVRIACEWALLQLRATLVRINVRESDVPAGHVGIAMSAEAALASIATAVGKQRPRPTATAE